LELVPKRKLLFCTFAYVRAAGEDCLLGKCQLEKVSGIIGTVIKKYYFKF